MIFHAGYIYHVYNQGNNRRKLFLSRENYLYFLKKVKRHLLPYADMLAWCLMPNHFHFMMLVQQTDLNQPESRKSLSLNRSIGIMLRSYTRAFNNANGTTGALFREETKAECINCPEGLTPAFFTQNGLNIINIKDPEIQYPQICFNYIHQNPVKAGLARIATDWEYSSALEYAGLREGKLVNKELAKQYVNF